MITNDDKTVTIDTGTEVHVYPLTYFEQLINGVAVEPLPAAVLAIILREWLADSVIEAPPLSFVCA